MAITPAKIEKPTITHGLIVAGIMLWIAFLAVATIHASDNSPDFIREHPHFFLTFGLQQQWRMFTHGAPDAAVNVQSTAQYADLSTRSVTLKGQAGILPSSQDRLYEINSSFVLKQPGRLDALGHYQCLVQTMNGKKPTYITINVRVAFIERFGMSTAPAPDNTVTRTYTCP